MENRIFNLRVPLLGVLFLASSQISSAQNFTEVQGTPFVGTIYSSAAFADVDGDDDQDVLITGQDDDLVRIAKLYTNDGSGDFSEVIDTPFDGVRYGAMAFGDVDGDSDQDVLITGMSDGGRISKLYTNDGSGNFTEVLGTPFDEVYQSSIAFADVDGDNDQDLLITGDNSSFAEITKLYINDGLGNFSEEMDTPFHGVDESSIAFADVDGDNDLDVLITGLGSGSLGVITKLYANDGTGGFTEVTDTPFINVAAGSVAFADVDGDNDQDLLITGVDLPGNRLSKLYTNDGAGSFTEATDISFEGVYESSVAFADVDGDNDQDLLLTGASMFNLHSIMYINDGSGNFTELMDTPLDPINNGSIAFVDIDGDSDQDVFMTGQNLSITSHISKLYINDGKGTLTNDFLGDISLNFTVFPNPATTDNLNIRIATTEGSLLTLSVFDMYGNLVSQQRKFTNVGEQTLQINIADLAVGTYTMQVENWKKLSVARFIVQ